MTISHTSLLKTIKKYNIRREKKIGICAHSYEGGSLCFITTCREGAKIMGSHMHPNIILSSIPMGLSMDAWESDNHIEVAKHLQEGVTQIYKSGADFFICPDNTAHIVLEKIILKLPIPGLHIVDVVCKEIITHKWTKVALLGTKWTMDGAIYHNILKKHGVSIITPNEFIKTKINNTIFEELCQGKFTKKTINLFLSEIENLKNNGAQCIILGCTEIPLIINSDNSPLPILDSTKLLSKYAVKLAISNVKIPNNGWIELLI